MATIDHIFISHYTKLVDRRKYMEKQIKEFGLEKYPITWITGYDRETISKQQIENSYKYDPKINPRPLCAAEICNAIAHLDIIKWAAKNGKNILIIEDDMIFKPNFLPLLETALTKVPQDWDVLCVGGFFHGDRDREEVSLENMKIVNATNRAIPTGCYLLNKKMSIMISQFHEKYPFSVPIDHYLMVIYNFFKSNAYWISPWLTHEGSKCGIFVPSTNGRGF